MQFIIGAQAGVPRGTQVGRRERKMKKQALLRVLGQLKQRESHKVLMDAKLLREHRPLRDTSSSPPAPMSQLHGPYNRCQSPGFRAEKYSL